MIIDYVDVALELILKDQFGDILADHLLPQKDSSIKDITDL